MQRKAQSLAKNIIQEFSFIYDVDFMNEGRKHKIINVFEVKAFHKLKDYAASESCLQPE